nr:hypothetical protein [Tanacetum cinerariifolium]
VKGIGHVSPIKSKLKVTGKSDSSKSRWILMSERLLNKLVVKEKLVDVIEKSIVIKECDKALVVAAVVIEKSAIDEKDNPKVTSKDNLKDKESDKAPVVAAVMSGKLTVDENDNRKVTSKVSKVSDESDKATVVASILKEKPVDVIEKLTVSNVVNEKEKPTIDVMSMVAKDKEKPTVDVTSKVGKSKAVVRKYKALDVVLKDKPKGIPPSVVGKGNAPSVVGKANDKPYIVKGKLSTEIPKKKHKADILKDKPKPKDKHKVDSKVHVQRSKMEVKAKASVSIDVKRKRMLSKEDRSKKKLELKMIKGKMVSDEVDSDESNKKGKNKEKQLTAEKAAHEEYLHEFLTLRARSSPSSLFSVIHEARIDIWSFLSEIGFSSFHNVSIDKIPSRLGRVVLEDLMRKASLDYPGDQKFVELQEKNVQVFKDPISSDVDVNSIDGGNDSDGDDDGDDDNDHDTLGSNPSFGFSKIRLDDLDKQPSQEGTDAEKESVNPTQKGTVVEGNTTKGCEIMSTPENIPNVSNQGMPTPDRMHTHDSNASASPGKRIVKPSSYLLSPYMNKKTKVVPKITRLKFSIRNSLFAMQGNKIDNVFETHSEGFCVYGIRLNLETLAPGFFDETFMYVILYSQNLCLMIHCLLMMTNEEASQIKLRLSLKTMKVVLFSKALTCLTSTTSMRILDNSVANYDTKYKEVFDLLGLQCDILKRLRFKFSTKILLHKINVHSKKMLELANEFDKVDSLERMTIIVEAVQNRIKSVRIYTFWNTFSVTHDLLVFDCS